MRICCIQGSEIAGQQIANTFGVRIRHFNPNPNGTQHDLHNANDVCIRFEITDEAKEEKMLRVQHSRVEEDTTLNKDIKYIKSNGHIYDIGSIYDIYTHHIFT